MRISDWSSDVCSSDLLAHPGENRGATRMPDESGGKTVIRTTCPRDCYDSCGVAVVKRDGSLKVLGDPDHAVSRGALCGKCAIAYNGAWRNPAARLLTPLKRVGRTGEGRFEPVGWETAVAESAARRKVVIARHGSETGRSEEHTSELRQTNRLSSADISLKK